jgi:hypothetical protein
MRLQQLNSWNWENLLHTRKVLFAKVCSDQVMSRSEMVAQPPDVMLNHAESYMYRVSVASVGGRSLFAQSTGPFHQRANRLKSLYSMLVLVRATCTRDGQCVNMVSK